MSPLDDYLYDVGSALPGEKRSDIIAELRVNLLSEMEDRTKQLGRTLTRDEEIEILRRHGEPIFVAARYRKENAGFVFGIRLIGPELFPIYKTVLGLIFGLTVAALAAIAFFRHAISLVGMLSLLAIEFAFATLMFILIDRYKDHRLNRWDPNS